MISYQAKTLHYEKGIRNGLYLIKDSVFSHSDGQLLYDALNVDQSLPQEQLAAEFKLFNKIKQNYLLFSHPPTQVKDFSYQSSARTLIYKTQSDNYLQYYLSPSSKEYIHGHCMENSNVLVLVRTESHFEFRLLEALEGSMRLEVIDSFSFDYPQQTNTNGSEGFNGPEIVFWKSHNPYIFLYMKNKGSRFVDTLYLFALKDGKIYHSFEQDLKHLNIVDIRD